MFCIRKSLISLITAAAFITPAAISHAVDRYVPSLQYPTIQSAINAAVAGDTLYVGNGTYHESLSWIGKDLAIKGMGIGKTFIDPSTATGGPGGRCLYTQNLTLGSRLEGFTFRNGFAPDGYGGGVYNDTSNLVINGCSFTLNTAKIAAGGMYNGSGSPTVTNCTFTQNSAGTGGGITNDSSNAIISNCTFTQNAATVDDGGGVWNYFSNPAMTDCSFNLNTCKRFGAGMSNLGSPTVTRCSFTQNSTYYGDGGGLFCSGGASIVKDCSFTANSAVSGGGLNVHDASTVTRCVFNKNRATIIGGGGLFTTTSVPVTNCIFTQNSTSGSGGAISNPSIGFVPVLTNCSLIGNTAKNGGGLYTYAGSPIVTHCTFAGNSASQYGGGMYIEVGNVTINNSILWGNIAPTYAGTNYYYQTTNSNVQNTYSALPNAQGNFSADPLFVRNPSPGPDGVWNTADDDFGDLHLKYLSPCRDRGNNGFLPLDTFDLDSDGNSAESLPVDLDGKPRVVANIVDMGAYEFQPNAAPTANAGPDLTFTVVHDGNPSTNVAAINITGTGTDPEKGSLTYQWSEGATIVGTAPTLSLSKPAGIYTFSLTVTDPVGLSSTDTVKVTVNREPNAAPIANAQSVSTNQDTTKLILLSASDPNYDRLTFTITSSPKHGSILYYEDNIVAYIPTPGYSGPDSFNFRFADPYGASSTATITINVVKTLFDVSGQIEVSMGAVMPGSTPGTSTQLVTLRNNGSTTIKGPISLILTNLAGATLTNRTGVTKVQTPAGRPYINTPAASLAPGATTTVSLQFSLVGTGGVSYTTQVLAGTGAK